MGLIRPWFNLLQKNGVRPLSPSFPNDDDETFHYSKEFVRWSVPFGDCNAEALAFCSDDNLFVDLDPARYDDFIAAKHQPSLLLYYEPSVVDSLFLREDDDMSGFLNRNHTIGRVNCLEWPELGCPGSRWLPMLGVTVTTAPPNNLTNQTSRPPRVAPLFVSDVDETTSSFYRLPLGTQSCLWRRFGAGEFSEFNDCEDAMGEISWKDQLSVLEGLSTARAWNSSVCALGIGLFLALILSVGRKFCWRRCCKEHTYNGLNIATRIFQQPPRSMTKDERKSQTNSQFLFFALAALMFGVCNMTFPSLSIVIGAPLALGTLVYVWVVDFGCTKSCADTFPSSSYVQVPVNDDGDDVQPSPDIF